MGGRDDPATVAAIAVLTVIVATVAHEAIGHGSACLAMGGHITQLTSVYFDCSVHGIWLPAAGPLGNLIAALLAWLVLRPVSSGMPRLRLLLVLIVAFNLFWMAGYLLYSAFTGEGDNAIVARMMFAGPRWALGLGLAILGLVIYRVAIRAVAAEMRVFADGAQRVRNLFYLSFGAGSIAAVIASAFYSPDRLHSAIQGALEISAASLPMLFLPMFVRPENAREGPIPRSPLWMIVSGLAYVAFVATLGRGLP